MSFLHCTCCHSIVKACDKKKSIILTCVPPAWRAVDIEDFQPFSFFSQSWKDSKCLRSGVGNYSLSLATLKYSQKFFVLSRKETCSEISSKLRFTCKVYFFFYVNWNESNKPKEGNKSLKNHRLNLLYLLIFDLVLLSSIIQ